MKRKLFLSFFCFFCALVVSAQQPNAPVEMADTFRSNGKIYVVVAVILTILAGIILYLVRLDKKLAKLEKDMAQ